MTLVQLRRASSWVRWTFHIAAAYGGIGIFVLAFLDSTILSFPFITDLLVVGASISKPKWMPFYAASATVGSLLGCISLYYVARKGGEAFFKRHARRFGSRVRSLVEKHAFLGIAIPAILPPPFPFEVFTIAEGVFSAPLYEFILGVLAGRGVRFFLEGLLALKYGRKVDRYVFRHEELFVAIFIAMALVGVVTGLGYWLFNRRTAHPSRES